MVSTFTLSAQLFRSATPLSSKALTKEFIMSAMRYPQSALDSDKQGKVVVEVLVSPDGKGSNARVLKSVNAALDQEAIRLAKKILWIPATDNGRLVSEKSSLDIVFNRKQFLRNLPERPPLYAHLDSLSVDSSGVIFTFAALETPPKPMIFEKYRSLHQYLQTNLKYPEAAVVAGVQGKVTIDFVVEEDGIPSNIRLTNGVGAGCDQEAIRLLQQLRWKPAIAKGQWVRSANTFEVSFLLNDKKQQQIPNRQPGGL